MWTFGEATVVVLTLIVVSECRNFRLDEKFPIVNNEPIIGILTEPLHMPLHLEGYTKKISSSYVKYLESAGARVVPVFTNLTHAEYDELFENINGVLFPGGDADYYKSNYSKTAAYFINKTLSEFKNNDYFPIHGTCLGMQMMTAIIGGRNVISASEGTWDTSIKLTFTGKESRIFKHASEDILDFLKTKNVTYNAHRNCVSSDTFEHNEKLKSFFNLITTNKDTSTNRKEFISTIEAANNIPIYGTQWHPEILFDFAVTDSLGKNINHSKEAVLVAQYMANFFVNECRRSKHRFTTKEARLNALIYNYDEIYTEKWGYFHEQIYAFK